MTKAHGLDELLEDNWPLLLHLQHYCQDISNPAKISCYGYDNFILHHIYLEILDVVYWPSDCAAWNFTNLSWYQMSSLSWSKISVIATTLSTQGSLTSGSSIGPIAAIEESDLIFHMTSMQVSGWLCY